MLIRNQSKHGNSVVIYKYDLDFNANGLAVSLLELPKNSADDDSFHDSTIQYINNDDVTDDVRPKNVSFHGFNLLYLIASKVKFQKSSFVEESSSSESRPHDIKLDSSTSRQSLRFVRRPAVGSLLYSDSSTYVIPPLILTHIKNEEERLLANRSHYYQNNVALATDDENEMDLNSFNRIIVGNFIGFELHFRVEEESGSG